MNQALFEKLVQVLSERFTDYELNEIFESWTLEDFLGAVEVANPIKDDFAF